MARPIAAARFSFLFIALSLLVILAGCGSPASPPAAIQHELAALTTNAAVQSRDASRDLKAAAAERKLIYTGSLTLAVKSLEQTEQQIKRLLATAEGQLAEFREERAQGNRRAARWKVRIPPAKFNDFVDQVADLGVAELRDVQTADVTEEYVDIEARLKNKRQLEARILKLLDEKAGELKDVVTVEGELARIREDIERIEGRLRYLGSQIGLSTVSIYACEKEEYQPPRAPTFRDRVAAALGSSLRSLRELSEGIVIASVALAPWAILFGLFLTIGWFVLTRILRRMTRHVQPS